MSKNTDIERKILALIVEVDPDKLYNDIHFDFINNKSYIWARNNFGDVVSLDPIKVSTWAFKTPAEGCFSGTDNARFRYSIRSGSRGDISQLFVRRLPAYIPDMEDLGYSRHKTLVDNINSGLVLVSGSTGSGKSTLMASLIKNRSSSNRNHIVTIEDPIEYLYPWGMHVSQREVGIDTGSFALGLISALREDPDVIMVGEIRDRKTAETAMTAAETGHLVFATIHSPGNVGSVQRMLALLGGDDYGRLRLSQGLKLCIHVSRYGMDRQLDILPINKPLENTIREGRLHQIESIAEQTSQNIKQAV